MGLSALEQIRVFGRHTTKRIAGTGAGDGTFVAVLAQVMPDLQME